MKDSIYYKQAELLLKVLPLIFKDTGLALKGGTAINFFVRNLPRLSIDIDLVYLPVKDREATLSDLTYKMSRIKEDVYTQFQKVQIANRVLKNTNNINGLTIKVDDATIKIATNTIIRGTVYKPEQMVLCKKAEEIFEMSLIATCLSMPDLYGGKICAALDRQHPRDLFDVKLLFDNEGFTEKIRKAFIVYLISHDRPIYELLNPNTIDMTDAYNNEFQGMTEENIQLKELNDTFNGLKKAILNSLNEDEKKFLLSFKDKQPDWKLLGLEGIDQMPSVKWKLLNLERMDNKKHKEAFEKLKEFLS